MHSDLHKKLDQLLRDREGLVFDWATNNCWHLAADWVLACTGQDLLGPHRNVGSLRGALKAIEEFGQMDEVVTQVLGEPINPNFAAYGDLVLVPSSEGRGVGGSLGVCLGPSVVSPGDEGLLRVPLSSAVKAWRVPK